MSTCGTCHKVVSHHRGIRTRSVCLATGERVQRGTKACAQYIKAHEPYECPGEGLCPDCEELAQAMNDLAPAPAEEA